MTGIINEDNEADSLNCCVHRLGESLMYLWWLFLPYIGRCIQLFSFDCVSWRVSENQFWSNWLMRYLAARPQHRALARWHSYAGIGTVRKCVVQIGIGETTHRRGDISARRSCWRVAHAPLTTSWPNAFRYSVSNMKVLPPIWIAAATSQQTQGRYFKSADANVNRLHGVKSRCQYPMM